MSNFFKIFAFLPLIFLLLPDKEVSAQTCGFGCLGLGGFYAGYSFQKYEADLLNERLSGIDPSVTEFGTAKGFRLGANIFRTKYSGVLLTLKGYYQFLNEQKTVSNSPSNEPVNISYALDLNYWGIGFDAGLNLFKYVDFKALDAQVTFHTAKLTLQTTSDTPAEENVYRSRKTNVGFQLGSGFIFHLVGDFISLETTAAYSNFSIGQLEDENQNIFYDPDPQTEEKFIEKGGLTLLVQLNIGIPLY